MLRLALSIAVLAAPVPALAQAVADSAATSEGSAATAELAGSWALKIDGAIIFRFDMEPDGAGWKGAWVRPKSFASTGDTFSRLSEDTAEIASSESKVTGEWSELTFPDNRPNAVPDVFRFRRLGPERAEMIYVDTGLAPFTLTRIPAGTALGPFVPGKTYKRMSVEMLGLPSDIPKTLSPRRPAKVDATPLPPRQSDKPVAGGR